MRKPFDGEYPITQTYAEHVQRRIEKGWTEAQYKGGIDYATPERTPILAVLPGDVSKVEMLNTGYGNVVKIDHANGLQTLYAHLSYIVVSVGQHVDAGQMIGRSGNTGNSTGPHLHFEVRQDGKAVDPQPLLDGQLSGNPGELTGNSGQLQLSNNIGQLDHVTDVSKLDHIVDVNKKTISRDQAWNLRAAPWGDKLALIYGGAEVEIIETDGEWCKVKIDITGYMHKTAFENWQV